MRGAGLLWLGRLRGRGSLRLGLAGLLVLVGCQRRPSETVVVYVAQDQVYAEPILRQFGRQTGIDVRAVYDTEAVKTVGLANRLFAERRRPRCDVFWGNEELRTRQLAARGVLAAQPAWAAVGYRSRRLVVNTNLLAARTPPSLQELTNVIWRRKVAVAYPLFGTTSTHLLALRQHWGEPAWESWCRGLVSNAPFLVDGNSAVVKLVARGEAWVGLTDSDDIVAVCKEGAPVAALPIGEETLLIPNTVAVVRGAPHPESAKRLYEYLQRAEVVDRLVLAGAIEGRSADEVRTPTLRPNWDSLLADLELAAAKLKEVFL